MPRRKPSNLSSPRPAAAVRHAVLVGLGNIGSQAADLLARLGIGEITLIDSGSYEIEDLKGQSIDPAAAGRPKTAVIAERLRRLNRDLVVRPLHARLQDVPLGRLRGADLMLCGLDSRSARAYANQATRWLGIPVLIDGGVEPSQLLARVSVHRSGPACSCLQCAWSDEDYDLIETRNPCQPNNGAAPATNAPAALGALAASILALEVKKTLDGDFDHVAVGKQITCCGLTHRLYVTAIGLNPQCRCDHAPWRVTPLKQSPARSMLGQALRPGRSLSVPGKTFIRKLACPDCGARREVLRLEGRLTSRQLTCARCGAGMVAPGFDQLDRLDVASLGSGSPWLRRPLARLGIARGDILCLGSDKGERHLEIGAAARRREVYHA